MVTSYSRDRPLTIIGAGPIGLAAAAKCVARNIHFRLLEAGGSAAWAVREWSHIQLFSRWGECVDEDARALLDSADWVAPSDDAYPDGNSLIRQYLAPLAALPTIAEHIRYRTRVVRVSRAASASPPEQSTFVLKTDLGDALLAGAVIDASGTWDNPRLLPRTGPTVAARVYNRVPDIRDPKMQRRLTGKRIAIIGSGHSGMTLLIDLLNSVPDCEITWLRRGAIIHAGAPIGPDSARLKLEKRAESEAMSRRVRVLRDTTVEDVHETPSDVRVMGRRSDGSRIDFEVDYLFAATGFDPDHSIACDLHLELDPELGAPAKLAELIDPSKHSCNTVPAHGWEELAHPEPGYFIVGSKSYGCAPNFDLSTGYAQLDSVLSHLSPSTSTGIRQPNCFCIPSGSKCG